MTATTFDTLRISKRLKAAGFSDEQAETVTGILRETRDADLTSLATKQDLQLLEQRLTIKLGSMLVVAVGAAAALVKLL